MSDTFKPVQASETAVLNTVDNGRMAVTTDTYSLYVDISGIHVKITDVLTGTYSNISGQVTPLVNKIYLATDQDKLVYYTSSNNTVTKHEIGSGGGGGGSSTLAGLTDVTISSPTSGQALVYNGSGWVNGSTTGSGGTKVVTVSEGNNAKTSLQAVTNLTPTYTGNTRGSGAVDLQQYRGTNSQVASGDYSVVMGCSNTANGDSSVAMGYSNTANGGYSVAMGYSNTAYGYSSVALGFINSTYSHSSVALGYNNTASSYSSVALGYSNSTYGYSSVALGFINTANGDSSVAMGYSNTANGGYSVAMGHSNIASGDFSTVFGSRNVAKAKYSVVTGFYNKSQIIGAVTNNNVAAGDTPLANIYNPYGHSGFKGLNVSDSVVELFKLSNTDQLVARIDVLGPNLDPVSFFITVDAAEVKYCNIQGNTTIFIEPDIYMSNGNLYLYTHTWNQKQIGIFYTLYSYTSAYSSSSSSSSSSSM